MAKKILFLSFKGGVGTTTFCLGLAKSLAARGERVLIVDGDDKSGSLLTAANCDGLQVYTLADAEKGACRAKQTLLQHPDERNLFLMPTLGCKERAAADNAVNEVEKLFDYVLCDGIAGNVCREATVVCEPYPPSVKSADKAICYLRDKKIFETGLVVNRANGGLIFDGETLTPQEIAALLHVKLKAAVPEDLGLPLGKPRKGTLDAFETAADNFSGKSDEVYNVIKPYYGVNGYFKRKMRSRL